MRLEFAHEKIEIGVGAAAATVTCVGDRGVLVDALRGVGDGHRDRLARGARASQRFERLVRLPFDTGECRRGVEDVLAIVEIHDRVACTRPGIGRRQVDPDVTRTT